MKNLIVEKSEENVIDLDVKIKNNSFDVESNNTIVRVVIEDNNNLNYSFNGYKKGDNYSVRIPKLEGIITEGEKKCFVEVVCHNRYFRVWDGKVVIINSPQVALTSRNSRLSLKEAINRNEERCQLVTVTEEVLV